MQAVPLNSYATLLDYGQDQGIDADDPVEDNVIVQLLEAASQVINDETGRAFFPSVMERQILVPDDPDPDLWLDREILEILGITNGNGSAIAANNYFTLPRNETPGRMIRLTVASGLSWLADNDGYLAVNGIWGYHDQYVTRGWVAATQINKVGGIAADETPITVDDGNRLVPGNIARLGNELIIVQACNQTEIIPVRRGDNGSTATTHADDTVVYKWLPMPSIRAACIEITRSAYNRRYGKNTTGVTSITGAGLVITPEEIPATAYRTIKRYKRDF